MNSIIKTFLFAAGLIIFLLGGFVSPASSQRNQEDLQDFFSLFDGETLNGWRKLTEYSGDAGHWIVRDGAIIGDQFPAGEGGLLVTEQKYSDFELYAEVKADYPIDSGIFLRVQPSVLSYQVTIDYRPDGEVGAIYCPTAGDFLEHKPEGKDLWKKDEFNSLFVRITGQPARIIVKLNGQDLVDYTDTAVDGKFRVPATGFVGIQVHPGASWGKGNKVYFRKLLLKPLD